MKDCAKMCMNSGIACPFSECRQHINYEEDLNCVLITVHKHGPLTLREVAPRMGVSFPRDKQIEDQARKKLASKLKDY